MGQRYRGDSGGDSAGSRGHSETAAGTVGQWGQLDSGWVRGTVVGTVVETVGALRQWWGQR
eukprot:8077072-Pyramimonas_sp.AAC.1